MGHKNYTLKRMEKMKINGKQLRQQLKLDKNINDKQDAPVEQRMSTIYVYKARWLEGAIAEKILNI